jgi:uncharacterized protein (UPF0147 family)
MTDTSTPEKIKSSLLQRNQELEDERDTLVQRVAQLKGVLEQVSTSAAAALTSAAQAHRVLLQELEEARAQAHGLGAQKHAPMVKRAPMTQGAPMAGGGTALCPAVVQRVSTPEQGKHLQGCIFVLDYFNNRKIPKEARRTYAQQIHINVWDID